MFRGNSETEARYSQQLQTGTGRRASFETVPPPRGRQSLGGKMSWCYGDWSRILIHGISSSTMCSEQTLSAFHYMSYCNNYSRTETPFNPIDGPIEAHRWPSLLFPMGIDGPSMTIDGI